MPGIVNHLVALEAAGMIGHDHLVEQNDDAIGMARTSTIRPAALASTL